MSAWPRMMLAAGPKTPPVDSRPEVGTACSLVSRPAGTWRSWNADRQFMCLTWGLLPGCRDRTSARGPGRPRAATAPMPLPHAGNFVGCLPGTTSANGDLSQSVIIAVRPGGGQGYFDKCSLSCHLQFGFASRGLPLSPDRPSNRRVNGAFHFGTLSRGWRSRAWARRRAPLGFIHA